MDLSPLETLGKVAGLGGIAIGVVARLVRPIECLPYLQRSAHRYSRLVATGAFGIGALGIID